MATRAPASSTACKLLQQQLCQCCKLRDIRHSDSLMHLQAPRARQHSLRKHRKSWRRASRMPFMSSCPAPSRNMMQTGPQKPHPSLQTLHSSPQQLQKTSKLPLSCSPSPHHPPGPQTQSPKVTLQRMPRSPGAPHQPQIQARQHPQLLAQGMAEPHKAKAEPPGQPQPRLQLPYRSNQPQPSPRLHLTPVNHHRPQTRQD